MSDEYLSRGIGDGAERLGNLDPQIAIFACLHVAEGTRPVNAIVLEGGDISATCGDNQCFEAEPVLRPLRWILESDPTVAGLSEARNDWAFMRPNESAPWRAYAPGDG